MKRPASDSARMPNESPISCWLSRMSPFSTWLNSCAITPWSSARSTLERAARDADRRIRVRRARRERVDAGLVLEDEDLGHRDAGRERHLLDDVYEPLLERAGAAAGYLRRAHHPRDVG